MEKSPFLAALQQARASSDLCSIYCDSGRPLGAVQGFVDFVSHDAFLVRVVDDHGFYDGFAWRSLEDVYRFEFGGEWEQKVAFLFQARGQKHPDFLPPLDISCDLQREVLLAAQRHERMVRVEILGKDWRDGWVEAINEAVLTLQLIDNGGHRDGECLVELESLNKIQCDNADLQGAKLLTRWSESQPPLN